MGTASEAGAHARHGKPALGATGYQYRPYLGSRPEWPSDRLSAAQDSHRARRQVCAERRNYFLHTPWGLVRVPVCDNFRRSAGTAFRFPKQGLIKFMFEELEQEYIALKDKVRDLREYL